MTELTPAQLAEHFLLYTNKNVFLTGKAGTGKTTFLRKITQSTIKKTIVAAPTGIAALNAKGVTLHSQFQLPFSAFLPIMGPMKIHENTRFETFTTLQRHLKMNAIKRKIIREAELLIIDEVSMLRADVLDAVDFCMRFVRKNRAPFGGAQVLFIGDMMQLPPVVKREEWDVLRDYYESPFFFHAKVLENNLPLYIELDKIYRQSDPVFTNLLNKIRQNNASAEDIDFLNQHYISNLDDINTDGYIRLTTHNREADSINQKKLDELPFKPITTKAKITGEFPENIYPCDKEMVLKEGAQVMFIKNDISGRQQYFNGKIGKIVKAKPEEIRVQFEDGEEIEVPTYKWENTKYTIDETTKSIKETIIGTFEQLPLRLAWAITIHKSQGLTFEKAIIDIEKVFASGQSYVALSRLKSLDGLILASPVKRGGIGYDYSLIKFEENKYLQGDMNQILSSATEEYASFFCTDSFFLLPVLKAWKEHVDTYTQADAHKEKVKNYQWAKSVLERLSSISDVAGKFSYQLQKAFAQKQYSFIAERLEAANNYFEAPLRELITEVYNQVLNLRRKAITKEYSDELEEFDAWFTRIYLHFKRCSILVLGILEGTEKAYEKWSTTNYLDWKEKIKPQTVYIENEDLYEEYLKSKSKKKKEPKEKKPKPEKGASTLATMQYFKDGLSIPEIAERRGLAESTICSHLTQLCINKHMKPEEVLSQDEIYKITDFLIQFDGKRIGEILTEAGDKLPTDKWKVLMVNRLIAEEIISL